MATKKYLDNNGLLYFLNKLKDLFASKSDAIKNITRSGTTFTATKADGTTFTFTQKDDTVSPYTLTPAANGTASAGSSSNYSRGDHVHPTDTTRAPLESPTFTGTPATTSPQGGDSSTRIPTTSWVQSEIDSAIQGISMLHFEKVNSLPSTGQTNIIYLVPNLSGPNQNKYDEWIYAVDPEVASGNSYVWEKIGTTGTIDLSGYVLSSELVAITNQEIDALFT